MLPYVLVLPKGAERRDEALRFMDWTMQPQAQLLLARGAGVWPMNKDAVLPPDLARELGGDVAAVMARNHNPDWFVVGSALEERTRRIEALIQNAK